ncbi:MAG: hypothetical protein JWM81_524 [Candidatus Saccharibacteria bacterium]|nr:hypothetical protein [Candidatus Saccharibacteria bacterium]
MQPNNRQRILYVLLGAALLVLVVFAAFKVSNYNAPAKPAVTQQEIAKRLSTPKIIPNAPSGASTGSPSDTDNSSQSTQAPQKPGTLAATGPANTLTVFLIAVAVSTMLAYARAFRTVNSQP